MNIIEIDEEDLKKEFIAYNAKVPSIKDIQTLNTNVNNKIELIRVMHSPNLKSMMVKSFF